MSAAAPQSRSRVRVAAILAEVLIGLLCGLVAAALCAFGGGWLFSVLVPDVGMALLAIMLYLGMLGFAVGAALGVVLAGRWQRQAGSWWLGLGGGVLGGVFVMALAVSGILGPFTAPALGLTVVAALGLAVTGYNLKH